MTIPKRALAVKRMKKNTGSDIAASGKINFEMIKEIL
jgi:hypothetical protein